MSNDFGVPPNAGAASPKAQDEMLRAVLESAAQAIITVDEKGLIASINPKTSEMFGYSSPELLGHPVELLLPEALRAIHVRHRAEYAKSPRVRPMGVGMDLLGRRKDGSEFPVEISLSYAKSAAGAFVIAFISDVTVRRGLEEQLMQSQKMEAVGRLAGGIAHDFNNLLTIIGGYDRMMLGKLSPFDPLRGYADEILKASERASALTRQLLAFSRRQMIQPVVLDLNELIRHSEKMLRRLITEDIELVVHTATAPARIKADPNQIEQVLLNLVVNARDALPRGGVITIEVDTVNISEEYMRTHLGASPGPYVMMSVSDNGVGMDSETERHIFEPFFTTKSQEQGTGLGLSTVYGIVKQNQGDIWVYSEVGRGTTMKVYLPEFKGEAPVAAEPEPETVARGTETVLVVEDEPGVRQLVAKILSDYGYSVLQASNGKEATEVFRAQAGAIDLVITDVVMPQGNGRELAEELAAIQPDLKVLYMSGYTENTIVHHGIADENLAFISKPFTFEALLAKVREVLRQD